MSAFTDTLPKARPYVPRGAAGPAVRGSGVVRFDPRAARDDSGAFLALGHTLFAGVWLYEHERDRLDRELDTIRQASGDFIRVIVDALSGISWADREMDSRRAGWRSAVAGQIDHAYDDFGIRTMVTIFGGIPHDGKGRAEAIVRDVVALVNERPHKVFVLEIANEGTHNGWTVDELRSMARLARGLTDVPVAVSAPGGDEEDLCELYRDDVADVATMHYERDFGGEPRGWRPVRKPWEYPWGDCSGRPAAALNSEPIGPYSSVNSDDDPLRLVMAFATTHLVGGGGYILHAGPGIRSGGAWDQNRGIPARLEDTPHWRETVAGIGVVKRLLPGDIADWARHNGHWPSNPIDIGGTAPFDRGDLVRLYTAERGGEVWSAVIGITRPVDAHERSGGALRAIDVLTGATVVEGRGSITLPARRGAAGDGYLLAARSR